MKIKLNYRRIASVHVQSGQQMEDRRYVKNSSVHSGLCRRGGTSYEANLSGWYFEKEIRSTKRKLLNQTTAEKYRMKISWIKIPEPAIRYMAFRASEK